MGNAERRFTVQFVVLFICILDVILEIHILAQNSVIISPHGGIIWLWSRFPEPEEWDATVHGPVRLAYDRVTLAPRSAVLVTGKTDVSTGISGVADGSESY